MIENYYQHYGLEHDPFPVEQEDDLFFSTPELEHRLELISHLVEFSDRFIVITGSANAGKTTLLKRLVNVADEKWRISKLPFKDIQTLDDFFEYLFREEGLDYREMDSVAMKVAALHEHFSRIHENNLLPVVLIDDGHRLSIELLKVLIDIATPEQNHGLHVVLFSDTDLAELLSHKNLGYVHSIDLSPLTEEQMRAYLDFRLKEAGYEEELSPISEKLIKQIHKTSGGLPGLINELAAKALSDPALVQNKPSILKNFIGLCFNTKITIPLALVMTAAFVVYILQSAETEIETTRTEVALPKADTRAAEIETGKETDRTETDRTETVEESDEPAKVEEEPEELVVITVPSETKEEKAPSLIEESDSKLESVTPAEPIKEANKIEIAVQLGPNQGINTSPSIEEAPRIIEAPAIEPTPVIEKVEPKKPEPAQEKTVISEEEKTTPPAKEVVKETTKEEKVAIAKPGKVPAGTELTSMRGTTWLKKQSPDHYVLQLMGAHDEAVINKFTSRYPELKKDLAKFKTVNQNKIWHVLVFGIYESREQAVAALIGLPAKIRSLKPWPRKIQTIHKDLN